MLDMSYIKFPRSLQLSNRSVKSRDGLALVSHTAGNADKHTDQ